MAEERRRYELGRLAEALRERAKKEVEALAAAKDSARLSATLMLREGHGHRPEGHIHGWIEGHGPPHPHFGYNLGHDNWGNQHHPHGLRHPESHHRHHHQLQPPEREGLRCHPGYRSLRDYHPHQEGQKQPPGDRHVPGGLHHDLRHLQELQLLKATYKWDPPDPAKKTNPQSKDAEVARDGTKDAKEAVAKNGEGDRRGLDKERRDKDGKGKDNKSPTKKKDPGLASAMSALESLGRLWAGEKPSEEKDGDRDNNGGGSEDDRSHDGGGSVASRDRERERRCRKNRNRKKREKRRRKEETQRRSFEGLLGIVTAGSPTKNGCPSEVHQVSW